MDWKDWKPTYQKIVSRLGIDPALDQAATKLLAELLQNVDPAPLLERLERVLTGKTVVICGAGPSLRNHLRELRDMRGSYEGLVFMAADGASSAFLEMDVPCDVIVTDLDGNVDDIIKLARQRAIVIVHAHGDNMEALRKYVPLMGPVLGTTQVEPIGHTFLWGGFTDGDRASFTAARYRPKEVIFLGMDFGITVGRWSKPGHQEHFPADERKRVKLEIAQDLFTNPLEKAKIVYKIWR